MTAEHAAEHASVPQGGWRDDLRQGVAFTLKRRKKLIGYAVTAAGFLVTNGLVHGEAQVVCNVVLALAGGGLVDGLRNAAARPRTKG